MHFIPHFIHVKRSVHKLNGSEYKWHALTVARAVTYIAIKEPSSKVLSVCVCHEQSDISEKTIVYK